MPNDYFFEHHAMPNEEKWETYCRTIRSIMSKEGNLPMIDVNIEDKFKYKEYIYPKSLEKHSDWALGLE